MVQAGTIGVTNGAAAVTGVGTAFVANVQPGHAINLPDGRAYEVAAINSDTQLTLGSNYLGATAAGQTYSVQPNQGYSQAAAAALATYVSQISGYVAGALAGRFGDGTPAAPGITFASDQDTGVARLAENTLALIAGGVARVVADSSGGIVNGARLAVSGATASDMVHSTGAANWSSGVPDGANRWRVKENQFGAELLTMLPNGNLGVGVAAPAAKLDIAAATNSRIQFGVNTNNPGVNGLTLNGNLSDAGASGLFGGGTETNLYVQSQGATIIRTAGNVERARVDTAGNLLVGTSVGSSHYISRAGNEGDILLQVAKYGNTGVGIYICNGGSYGSGAACTMRLGAITTTNRSINAAGTINASGADYAEYMRKAAGCGAITKGDVCGVDRDGRLTRTWADAVSYKIKSTEPNLVGGDTWSQHLGDRPVEPVLVLPDYRGPVEPVEPVAPAAPTIANDPAPVEPLREDGEEDIDFIRRMAAYFVTSAAWIANMAAFQEVSTAYASAAPIHEAAVAAYARDRAEYDVAQAAHAEAVASAQAEHEVAVAQYRIDLAAFEAALEAARQGVDRIAYCGRVPVNVDGPCTPGDYLVAVAKGGGIGVKAVADADITFADYRRRVGRVLSIDEDGRPVVDVMQG